MAFISKLLFAVTLSCIFLRPFTGYLISYGLDYALWLLFAISACPLIILNKKRIVVTGIDYALLCFVLSVALSFSASTNLLNSLRHLHLYTGPLLVFYFIRICDERKRNVILKTMFFSFLALCLYGIYQYCFGFRLVLDYLDTRHIADPFAIEWLSRKRIFATFFSPNAYAGYLTMLLPLCVYLRRIEKTEFSAPVFLLAMLLGAANLILTASISGIYSILIACLVVVALGKHKRPMFIAASITLIAILLTMFYLRYHSEILLLNPTLSYKDRINYYKEALLMITQHPWKGLGIGNFHGKTSLFVHNSYLQIWIETGMAGFVGFLVFLSVLIKRSWQRINTHSAIVCALVSFIIDNLLSFTFFLPEVNWVWWIAAGLIVS